jgi:hypothetical protein
LLYSWSNFNNFDFDQKLSDQRPAGSLGVVYWFNWTNNFLSQQGRKRHTMTIW